MSLKLWITDLSRTSPRDLFRYFYFLLLAVIIEGHHKCTTFNALGHSYFYSNVLLIIYFYRSCSGLFSTADPDNANQVTNRQTFTYTLMGNTAGLPFIIDGDALNSTRSLDFEVQSSWIITVRSVDSGDPALSLIKTFQISVVGKLKFELCLTTFALRITPSRCLTKSVSK